MTPGRESTGAVTAVAVSGPARLIVVTVTLNDLAGLKATFASLKRQTRQDYDWVVVDGGSSDGTAAWLQCNKSEIMWWRSAPDDGIYDAMNIALSSLQQRLRDRPQDGVLFLNSGDTLAIANVVESITLHLGTSSATLLYGDAIEFDAHRKAALKRSRSHRLAILGMFTHHQSMVYRAGIVAGMRYSLEYPIGADYDFTLKVLEKSTRVDRLAFPFCAFRGQGASWKNAWQGRYDQQRIRKQHYQIATLSNLAVATLQRISQALKTLFPSIYANLRYKDLCH